jgi:two-component system, NarL family, nitrate/nitrite response regulator NarL
MVKYETNFISSIGLNFELINSKMKILIADDSSLFRERIKDLLKTLNNIEIIGEASDGVEAIQLIDDKSPDIVFLDIRMPLLNGIEVLRKTRSKGNKVLICMLTNFPYKQYRERCIAEGADYFFDKNLDMNLLLNVISTIVNN